MEQAIGSTPSESTIRRRAAKAGFFIRKSRGSKFYSPYDYGEYTVFESFLGYPVYGEFYTATLSDICEFLADEGKAAEATLSQTH